MKVNNYNECNNNKTIRDIENLEDGLPFPNNYGVEPHPIVIPQPHRY